MFSDFKQLMKFYQSNWQALTIQLYENIYIWDFWDVILRIKPKIWNFTSLINIKHSTQFIKGYEPKRYQKPNF